VEAFLEAGPAPAVVTFGSMAFSDPGRLGRVVADALARAGLRGVIQAGAAGIAPEPSSDLLPTGEVDHRSLLPRAAVVVHHGGAGTSHAVAAAGVPSVVIPHVGDQAFWADRLRRLGAAPAPLSPRKLNADTLADRLRTAATSAQVRAAAGNLQRRLAREDGLVEAVSLLEGAASTSG
jgi:UDP:flavonoid glycosyltransferase YjiC (YdhE family)